MLTLICGQPRAGKTTYSGQFENVLHLDEHGYHETRTYVSRTSEDVVVEGVYNKTIMRKKLIHAYHGSGFKCILLDTPDDIRHSRRGWDRYCDLEFELPTYEEGWDEIEIIR